MLRRPTNACLLSIACFGVQLPTLAETTTHVLTETRVDGQPSEVEYDTVDVPTINDSGQFIYRGRAIDFTNSVLGTFRHGLFATGIGGVPLIVEDGTPAPALGPNVDLVTTTRPMIDDVGEPGFFATLSGVGVSGSNDGAYFKSVGGNYQVLAREGDRAPGIAEIVAYDSIQTNTAVNNGQGQVVFYSWLAGQGVTGSNNEALFSDVSGSFDLVVREGMQAPGAEAGTTILLGNAYVLSDSGKIAFTARLSGAGVSFPNNAALYAYENGSLNLVARGGQAAPGLPAGMTFTSFADPAINDSGSLALRVTTQGGGVSLANEQAIVTHIDGVFSEVVRHGDAVPNADAGVVFDTLYDPAINNHGDVVFYSEIDGFIGVDSSNDSGIFRYQDGSLELIAREGDAVPGLDPALRYSNFQFVDGIDISDTGQIAFISDLFDQSENRSIGRSLFLTDTAGVPHLVAQQEMLFDVDDDPLNEDLRQINFLAGINTAMDSKEKALTDDGELFFELRFLGGSEGIFSFTLDSPVPGDTDGDGDVDDADLGTSFANYTGALTPGTGDKTPAQGDTDGDGDVDDADLGTSFAGYTGALTPASVPEPTSLSLVLSAGLIALRPRHRA